MLDHKSYMGYRKDSPYQNDPFIDIFSPEGKIDMSQTDRDIVGIDEYGNVQMMVGGRKQMYQFEGQKVREIPLDQLAMGGLSSEKAKKMLREGVANGRQLTEKQRSYFGWVAGGKKQQGGEIKSYNPNLALKDKNFLNWYSKNTIEGQNGIPYSEDLDYDYYSFFRNNGIGNIQSHFPDTYKRPSHSTFSDESIYSIPENIGGHWKGDVFIPPAVKKQVGGSIPNLGYPGMLQEFTLEDALKQSPNLKFTKSGKFKGLIPLEDWNDDVMNYIDKFKMVKRKGEPFVKVRGKIERQQQSPYVIPSTPYPTLQMGGNPYTSTSNYLTDFLFEEDEPVKLQQPEVVEEEEIDLTELRRKEQEEKDLEEYNMTIQLAMQAGENPYSSSIPTRTGEMSAPSGFKTFGSYEEGRAALENQLNLYKTGRTKNPVKPTSTLYEAMSVYAPAADKNDPKNYANFIARKLGISVDTPIYKIDTGRWADAITIMEGNKRGNNPGNLR